jgi:hypothetical protein
MEDMYYENDYIVDLILNKMFDILNLIIEKIEID